MNDEGKTRLRTSVIWRGGRLFTHEETKVSEPKGMGCHLNKLDFLVLSSALGFASGKKV